MNTIYQYFMTPVKIGNVSQSELIHHKLFVIFHLNMQDSVMVVSQNEIYGVYDNQMPCVISE